MDIKTYLQEQITTARRLFDAASQNTTAEQFHWMPEVSTVNSISVTLLHVIGGEDRFVQQLVQGKPTLWETEQWAEKFGVARAPGMGQGWEDVRSGTFTMETAQAYKQVVRAATDAYLATITPAELDRELMFMGEQRRVANVLIILTHHMAYHAGDIATIKGMLGVKGLPF